MNGLTPRFNRRRALLAAAGISVVILGGVLALALSGGGAPRTTSVAPLLRAAYVVTHGPGYRFKITIETTAEEKSSTFAAEGTIDEHGEQGVISGQVAGHKLTEIVRYPDVFVNISGVTNAKVTGGKPWLKLDIAAYESSLGLGSQAGASNDDPTQFIDYLTASSDATLIGHESIRGEATTHYHAVVNLAQYVATLAPRERDAAQEATDLVEKVTGSHLLPIDVWLGAGDRLRRYQDELHFCASSGLESERVEVEILHYGPEPAVEVPAEAETKDLTSLVKSEVSKTLTQLKCS